MIQKRYLVIYLIIALHGFILSHLIFFPYPEFFIYPYLTDKGLLPYAQIFDQHFPGLLFLPINLHNLGMTDETVARQWLISIVILCQLLIYWVTYKISGSYKKATFACMFYLIWQPFLEGWVFWIDNFLPLFLIPAFYFSYMAAKTKDAKFDLFAAGFFMSLAILFKQVAIPLAGGLMVLFLYWRIKGILFYLIGLFTLLIITGYYFFKLKVLSDIWFWAVEFNLTTFAKYGGKPPFISGVLRVFGVYSSIILLLLSRERKLQILLAFFIIGSFSGDLARFDFVHFQPSLPFVVIITSLYIDKFWRFKWAPILTVWYLLVTLVWLVTFYKGHFNNRILFFDQETKQVAEKIKYLTQPGQEIYLFGPVPHIYQMSETIPAGRIFVFQFPWFMMDTEDKFVTVLKNDQPELIVRDRTVIIEGRPITEFARRIDRYIELNYQVFDQIGNNEFLRRKTTYYD